MVKKYITSYGDRPNEYRPVLEYFKGHFQHVHRKHNSGNRYLYTHYTRVVVGTTLRPSIPVIKLTCPQDSRDTHMIMTDGELV
jgi:hypothetical protein